MPPKKERDEERFRRAREKGDAKGEKAKNFLAAIAAFGILVAAFAGQVFTWLAANALELIGFVSLAVSVMAVGIAGAIKRSSDEPKERLAWSVALVLVIGALLFYLGKL